MEEDNREGHLLDTGVGEPVFYTAVLTKVVPQKCKSVRDNADWCYG